MEWRHTSSPVKVTAKQTLSKRNIMATIYSGRHGVLLGDLMPQVTIINPGAYCATLQKLRRALQNKWRGMLSKVVLLLHGNARHPTSQITLDLIQYFGREVFDHTPYRPTLLPAILTLSSTSNMVLARSASVTTKK
ncbi:uncharacterized protein TNCV_3241311 [Trichonephila clavipes]|nr:uncharacterized protein TNCV_3241311 [Trichonephila clavipes]